LKLYTHAGYDHSAYLKIEAEAEAARASNTPFAEAHSPNPDDPDFYVLDEPGDDKFDVPAGFGTCTDTNLAYAHTGCMDTNGAKFSLAVTGCFGRAFVHQRP